MELDVRPKTEGNTGEMTEEELKQEAEEWVEKNFCPHCFHKDIADCEGFDLCGVSKIYLASAEPREKRIAELEQENAELKEKYKLLGDIALIAKNVELENNITKAKEIIKKLISAYTSYADSFDDRDNKIVEEAEQFLKDSEEK